MTLGAKPFNVDLGALYEPLISHTLLASVHRTDVNAFKITKFKTP